MQCVYTQFYSFLTIYIIKRDFISSLKKLSNQCRNMKQNIVILIMILTNPFLVFMTIFLYKIIIFENAKTKLKATLIV